MDKKIINLAEYKKEKEVETEKEKERKIINTCIEHAKRLGW